MSKRPGKEHERFLAEQRKRWAVCVHNEKTFLAMFTHCCSLGLTGPLHTVSFVHFVYKNIPQLRYSVPKAVVDHLTSNRRRLGYDFYGFSKTPTTQWALHSEGKRLHIQIAHRLFNGKTPNDNRSIQREKIGQYPM